MRVIYLIIYISFLQIAQVMCQDTDPNKLLYHAAYDEFEQGNYTRAIELFDSLNILVPNNPKLNELLARCHLFNGNKDLAIDHIVKSIDIDPTNAHYQVMKALIHSLFKEHHFALRDMRRVALYENNDPDLLTLQAGMELQMGNFQDALTLYEQHYSLFPENIDTRYYLGYVHNVIGDTSRCHAIIKELIKEIKDSSSVDIKCTLALSYSTLGHADSSRFILDALLEENPDNNYARELLSIESIRYADYNSARSECRKVLISEPTNAFTQNNLAYCLIMLDSLDNALIILNNLIEKYPYFYNAYGNRGNAYMQLDSLDLAMKDLNMAISIKPNHPGVYKLRGELYKRLGDIDNSCKDLMQAKRRFYGSFYNRTEELNTIIQSTCN